ncbi:YvrJ family protein [Thermacetogenium phaeum]|nr:YvrJ family protein [Thermacetogenium phaeum]
MEDIWMQIGNYGFPMLVAVYLLVRVEKKLDTLTEAITRLEQVLSLYLRSSDHGVKEPTQAAAAGPR